MIVRCRTLILPSRRSSLPLPSLREYHLDESHYVVCCLLLLRGGRQMGDRIGRYGIGLYSQIFQKRTVLSQCFDDIVGATERNWMTCNVEWGQDWSLLQDSRIEVRDRAVSS